MIRDLTELAVLAAVGGTLSLGGCAGGDTDMTDTDMTDTDTDGGCPTGGCPTGGCPTGGCPTGGCPTSGFEADYASNPDFFTNMAAPVAGASPHGTVRIYYSADLRSLIDAGGSFTAPVGATSIKEVYTGADVTGIVTMTKQEAGFDAANNDWYYEVQDAAGAVQDSGALPMCIGCHAGGASTDYLLGTTL